MLKTPNDKMMRPKKRIFIKSVCPACGHKQIVGPDEEPNCKKCMCQMVAEKVILK